MHAIMTSRRNGLGEKREMNTLKLHWFFNATCKALQLRLLDMYQSILLNLLPCRYHVCFYVNPKLHPIIIKHEKNQASQTIGMYICRLIKYANMQGIKYQHTHVNHTHKSVASRLIVTRSTTIQTIIASTGIQLLTKTTSES